jgi:hypothetical protein
MASDHWPPQPRGPQQQGWNPRMSISNSKGLLNAPGENNCFLNSAVQVRLISFNIMQPFFLIALPRNPFHPRPLCTIVINSTCAK